VARIRDDASLAGVGEVQNVIEFIGKSKRGIISAPRARH
jgi:hypothetical protein